MLGPQSGKDFLKIERSMSSLHYFWMTPFDQTLKYSVHSSCVCDLVLSRMSRSKREVCEFFLCLQRLWTGRRSCRQHAAGVNHLTLKLECHIGPFIYNATVSANEKENFGQVQRIKSASTKPQAVSCNKVTRETTHLNQRDMTDRNNKLQTK